MADGSQQDYSSFLSGISTTRSRPFSSPLNPSSNPLPRTRVGATEFSPQLSSLAGSPINPSDSVTARSNLGQTIEAIVLLYGQG